MAEPEVQDEQQRVLASRPTAFETVLIVGGLVLFLVLLYEMTLPSNSGDFLNPILVAAAGVILLWPLRKQPTAQALMLSAGFLLFVWFLARLSSILIPFGAMYLLAYLFNPLVTEVQNRFKVPRWASSTVLTALVIGVLVLFVVLLVPNIVGELKTLASRILNSINEVRQWIASSTLLSGMDDTGLINKDDINTRLTIFIQEQAQQLAEGIPNFVQGVFRSISSVLGLVTILTILPVVLFYLLKDYPFIQRRLVELFPTRDGRRDYLLQASGIVGNYLRGQLLISGIGAFNVSVLLILLDVPFALLIGLLAGLLNMIPNLGALITMILGVLLMLIFGDPWYWDVLKVVAVLLGQGILESSVLTPKIMSHQVGLHPVMILLSLFVFGYFMGIFGLLIAVPATAILMTVYKAYRDEMTIELLTEERPPRHPSWFQRRAFLRKKAARETAAASATPKDTPEESE
jgi:predicted PurR-regulated permease PerM